MFILWYSVGIHFSTVRDIKTNLKKTFIYSTVICLFWSYGNVNGDRIHFYHIVILPKGG